MKKYKYLLFDLDGTLTDSCEGIYKSFEYALNFYGVEVDDLNTLKPVLGPPLKDSFMDMFGFDEKTADEAVAKYRERFSTVGLYENRVYDGVYDMLEALKKEGYFIALATSKPEKFARVILKHFELEKYFDFITGATIDGKISTKEDVIKHIIESLEISDVDEMLMIGDRKYDLIGAKIFGIDALGVLYGYGSKDELLENPSVLLAKSPDDVVKFLV